MIIKHKIITASRNKIFLSGLLLRALLIIFFFPDIQRDLFVPFFIAIFENPTLSTTPWQTYLNINGSADAFPYGPIMIAFHLPFVFLGWLVDISFDSVIFSQIGFKLSLLFADLTLLLVLVKIFESNYRKVLLYYWLSPIVIYITYVHGQTDIIPVSLFTLALYYLKRTEINKTAIALSASISAKFSMLITIPFIALYLFVNKKYRTLAKPFFYTLVITTVALNAPFFLDHGFQTMVINNDQTERLFSLGLNYHNDIYVYLTPLILLIVLFLIWRQSKINFDLLMAVLSVGFFAIILTSVAPPGWYIWLAPFLVQHQIRHGRTAIISVAVFSTSLIVFSFISASSGHIDILNLDLEHLREVLNSNISDRNLSILFTGIISTGLIILIQIIKSGIQENNFFHPNNKKISIGITGDVNAGKKTLAESIEHLFGLHSVCHLSGNNYHKWDKFSPMWKTISPINPRANLLMNYTNDALKLVDGKDIYSRQYNTDTGFFSKMKSLKSNDIVIVSGFHALFSKHLRHQLDLKIFIEIDNKLKTHISKLNNKHSTSEMKSFLGDSDHNKQDSQNYIQHQKDYADIIFSLEPLSETTMLENPNTLPQLKLKATIRHGIYYIELQRAFIGLCNLNTNLQLNEELGAATLEIDGELDFRGEDATLAIQMICPNILELLDTSPKWHDGMLGIMQVIIMAGINQSLQEQK